MAHPDELNAPANGSESQEIPFRVVVKAPHQAAPVVAQVMEDEEGIPLDEIEAAYMRALETADQAESMFLAELNSMPDVKVSSDAEPPDLEENIRSPSPETPVDSLPPQSDLGSTNDSDDRIISAEQVMEALLFVGGASLPAKKFLDVLGGTHTAEQVELMLESINSRYVAQRRPYEIRLVEGGYRLQLTSDYETVRGRAYGQGPKEVKLAQDALEVLAFVAYRQPIGRENLEETGKLNLPGLLRQLLRRELLYVDRSDAEAGERYRTTGRFLELFGLSSLEDLPQAGTFNFK